MAAANGAGAEQSPRDFFLAPDEAAGRIVPVHLVTEGREAEASADLPATERSWIEASGFQATAKRHLLVPATDGSIARVLLGLGKGRAGEPAGPADMLAGALPGLLPAGGYQIAGPMSAPESAAIAWGLGAYKFTTFKTEQRAAPRPRLVIPAGVSMDAVLRVVEGVWLGRDLINTPAGDLGPAELEQAASRLAARHGAEITSVVGDALLAQGYRLIHAVGRASTRPPRLIEMSWGRAGAPKITLVGKGICFDTGGLDIKPSSGMLLMKKDMGGAAAALAAAHMIMGLKLDVRLKVIIAAAENSIAGNAFRPGDVIKSRAGATVEIGNTDAEGRLVLADAIDRADEDAPELLVTLATLTGAARVALGPDLPPLFTDNDPLAAALLTIGESIGDPVWRLPLWPGYERMLASEVADMGNVSDGPFAGSIVAALFLRRFVKRARRFAHFDIYGWTGSPRAIGPKGGEPHAARLLFELLRRGLPA